MSLNNGFATIVTNRINKLSPFYSNSVCCLEPLHKMVQYAVLKSHYTCNDFYFDDAETRNKDAIEDFIKKNSTLPILVILRDCFDISENIIEEIFSQYLKTGDVEIFDKKNNLFAYVMSPDSNLKESLVDVDGNLSLVADGEKMTKYGVDYTVPSTLKELREKSQKLQEEIFAAHEKDGVQFVSFDGVGISPFAKIYEGVVIYSGTIIRGNSIVGSNTVLGPNTIIDASVIGENCMINSTQVYSSTIDDDVRTGPFCHIRPNCKIESGVRLGDFVEVKNSNVGKDTHASHLTYIGDSDVGERVNFGCGSITTNYDGVRKYRCTIGDDAFIGCNTNLIAPINVGEGAYTAAGSTLSIDIPPNALAISRAREQKIIDGWVKKYKKKGK